jgi:hypothetical protein
LQAPFERLHPPRLATSALGQIRKIRYVCRTSASPHSADER